MNTRDKTHQYCVIDFGTAILKQAGDHHDVIHMYTSRSGVQLDRTLDASIVEEVHLEMLHHITIMDTHST